MQLDIIYYFYIILYALTYNLKKIIQLRNSSEEDYK